MCPVLNLTHFWLWSFKVNCRSREWAHVQPLQPGTTAGASRRAKAPHSFSSTTCPCETCPCPAKGACPARDAPRQLCFLPFSLSLWLLECVCTWWKKCKEQGEAARNATLPVTLPACARLRGQQAQWLTPASIPREVGGAPDACSSRTAQGRAEFWG